MKISVRFNILFIILLILVIFLDVYCVSAVRINEVELNPQGTDSGNEWIELYSEQEINMTDWIILSSNGRNMTFNASFLNFFIINTPYNLLTNDNNKLSLLNSESSLISETIEISDSYDDSRTWQFCDNIWMFANSTKGLLNYCLQNNTNPATQNTSKQNSTPTSQKKEIIITLDYDSEIYSDEEFEVKLTAENLENYDYDAKMYIEYDEGVISQVYNEDEDKWVSGRYYVDSVLSGPGEDSYTFSLKLGKGWENFTGRAKIYARLRKGSSSSYKEESDSIKFIKKAEEKSKAISVTNLSSSKIEVNKAEDIIKLEKGIKSYKSRTEYIKEYSIYGFTLFLVVLVIVLIIWKRWRKNIGIN